MEKISLVRGGFLITNVCNLRCRLCSNSVPFHPYHRHTPVENLCHTADRFFEIVSHVGLFELGGGEGLTHPGFAEFIRYVKKYRDQFDILKIVTNGTIVPGDNLIDQMKSLGNKADFLVDNYGETISRKIPEIDDILRASGIHYAIRDNNAKSAHCGGWVDYGALGERILSNEEDIVARYRECAQPQKLNFCFFIHEGKLFPCGPVFGRFITNKTVSPGDYIDIDDEAVSTDELKRQIKSIQNGKILDTCAYCNGMREDS